MAVPTVASGCANSAKSGVEALEAGDYKEAQAQFEKLTEEKDKKKSAEGYRGLAMTYYEQEEYSSALDAFKKAVDTGVVQTTQIYNLMGICAMKTEDYEAALEYIQAENAKQKASEYLIEYPEDTAMEREAEFLETR